MLRIDPRAKAKAEKVTEMGEKSPIFVQFYLLTNQNQCGIMAGPLRLRGPEFCQYPTFTNFGGDFCAKLPIDFFPEMVYTIVKKER